MIASDNTLGAYSPFEGRIYVAYVGRFLNNNTPADNTDIYLVASDDGGQTWFDPTGNPQFNNVQGAARARPTTARSSTTTTHRRTATARGRTRATRHPTGANFDDQRGFDPQQRRPGRPQFQPSIAVDPVTGTLGLSWYDARNDPALARVATYVTTSIDGGNSFSPDVYANDSQIATDAITGNFVNVGPIPANESAPSATGVESGVGYGSHQGLAMYDGQLFPIWSDDLNGGTNNKLTLGIYTNVGYYAAGPRIISATQGPIGLPGDLVNSDRDPTDGTPIASEFLVTFDRPIDPSTFTASDVVVMYRDTTAGDLTGGLVPVTSVVPLNLGPFGATEFQVNFAPRSGVGTYSLEVTSATISDRIRTGHDDRPRRSARR